MADLAPKALVDPLHEPDTGQQEEFQLPPEQNVDFRVGFDGWQTDEQVPPVLAALQGVVGPLRRIFNFERLDGLTFAANYERLLLDLDRGGGGGISQPQSAPPEGGLGIAMAPKLEAALQSCGLRAWFDVFAADLDTLWSRLGEWSSFDEFLAFNRHVERVIWQFGLVPWLTDEGNLHIQVPIATDAVALLEATARGVPLPFRGTPTE